jgi:hypothetical protein
VGGSNRRATTIVPEVGYWIHLGGGQAVPVTVRGIRPTDGRIALKAGWNLISVPFSNAQYTVPPSSVQVVYSYNPVTRGYEPVQLSSLEPGKAYWVASTRDCIINITGMPVTPISRGLKAGWNLVGGSGNPVAFGSIGIDPSGSWSLSYVYGYNTQTKIYEQAATLQPGTGYWGAVNRDCIITVP